MACYVYPSLALLNSAVDLLEKAMELEYMYGSQNGLIPVVDYVLNSLNEVECTTKFNPACYNNYNNIMYTIIIIVYIRSSLDH